MGLETNWVKESYKVPADIGRRVYYEGKGGGIIQKTSNYVEVNFDCFKPGQTCCIHPTDDKLKYLEEFGTFRKLTPSQQRYHDYIRSEYAGTFAEYLGIEKKVKYSWQN